MNRPTVALSRLLGNPWNRTPVDRMTSATECLVRTTSLQVLWVLRLRRVPQLVATLVVTLQVPLFVCWLILLLLIMVVTGRPPRVVPLLRSPLVWSPVVLVIRWELESRPLVPPVWVLVPLVWLPLREIPRFSWP